MIDAEKNLSGKREDDYLNISLYLSALKKRWWAILIVSVLFGAVVFIGTHVLITPTYQSSFTAYVNNSASTSTTITNADITASRSLTATYAQIIVSQPVLDAAAQDAGIDYSYSDLKNAVSVKNLTDTEIIRVLVVLEDPEAAYLLSHSLESIAPPYLASIVTGSSMMIIAPSCHETVIYGPNYRKYTIAGALIGALLMLALILLRTMTNPRVTSDSDIEERHNAFVLASVHDLLRGRKLRGNIIPKSIENKVILQETSPYQMQEDYRNLRTSVMSSLSEKGTKVITVTSSFPNEGKSTTAINLAASLAMIDKHVILVECDLRNPSLKEKLRLTPKKGLTEFLSGSAQLSEIITKLPDNDFYVIPAGAIPSDPSVLLQSTKMEALIKGLRTRFEYILIDCPPVGLVIDAVDLARISDGYVLVTKHNQTDHHSIENMIKKLTRAGGNILGFVYNYAPTSRNETYGYGYGTNHNARH